MNVSNFIQTVNRIDSFVKSVKLNVSDQEYVRDALNAIIRSNEYINFIKLEFDKIVKDNKITAKDTPIIIHIILESLTYIKQLCKGKYELNKTTMKYIILGIVIYMFTDLNIDEATQQNFLEMFESLYDLISFDPKQLTQKIKKCFTCK